MLAPETVTFLEGGCALIVGTVGVDGVPHASRGWGLTVLSTDPVEMRLLLAADDATAIAHLSANANIAVTGGNVLTLHSIQLKGAAHAIEAATDDDRARADRFTDAFFADVTEVDGTPRAMLERLRPEDYVACLVRVAELFDQTPGPAAGGSLPEAGPST